MLAEDGFVLKSESDSWSASDRPILDLVAVHSEDNPTAGTTGDTSGLHRNSGARMLHAVELPVVAGLPRISDAEIDLSHRVFLASDPVRRSRCSSSGGKAFLSICVLAIPLAFVFAFASARPTVDITSIWAALTAYRQVSAPAPLQTMLSLTIEPRSITSTTSANDELQLSQSQVDFARPPEARESSTSGADVATTQIAPPNNTLATAGAPQAHALPAPTEAESIAARTGPEPEGKTALVEPTTHSEMTPNAARTSETATPEVPATTQVASDNGPIGLKTTAMPDVSLGGEPLQVGKARAGVWTSCVVNLIPSGQIAIQKAMTYQACISAGKKCAGPRRYAEIQFFDRPTLTSKVPLELCDKDT
jgi:hypothetical protein